MTASTVAQYLAALPADRRAALSAVRNAINENLPDGYEEGTQFGMIGWYVPLSVYPAGYGENPKVPLSLLGREGWGQSSLLTLSREPRRIMLK